jgi:DNA (cytosine-5)-methyltransferase 1
MHTPAGGFISVCSGIEAVSEAWRELPLGPVLYSEIEPFPISVLRQRHNAACMRKTRPAGSVPLYGDFTAMRIRHLLRLGVPLDLVEILSGGLADARGNLSLEFVRLANAVDNFRRHRGLAPIIIGWENVEGVLSMPDNAFGCFLAGLAGADSPLVPPKRHRWTNAGLVIGPRRAVAWRLFDAQYFGLAQRRQRVLVVASARKQCIPAILFESEGLRRDSPPRREKGQGITHELAPCLGASGLGFERAGETRGQDPVVAAGVAPPLTRNPHADNASREGLLVAFGGNNTSGPIDVATALSAHAGPHGRLDFESETFIAHTLRGEGFDASEDGTGRGTPLVPVPRPVPSSDVVATLDANYGKLQGSSGQDSGHGHSHLVPIAFDCKASGQNGFGVGAIDPTLRAMGHNKTHQNAGGHVAVAIPILEPGARTGVSTDDPRAGIGVGVDGDPMFTLQAGKQHGVFTQGAKAEMPQAPASMAVRRLTPTECERLQGFSDGYTAVMHRGKPAADGPRYKALGNSMPVPLIRWFGERISAALDEEIPGV